MRNIWVKKSVSFKEAEEFDRDYYFSMTRSERLDIAQFLRETYRKLKGFKGADRMVKIARIIK